MEASNAGGFSSSEDHEGVIPSKPLYKRAWFWVLIVLFVVCGGVPACMAGACVYTMNQGFEEVEDDLREQLAGSVAIQEHIGVPLSTVEMRMWETMQTAFEKAQAGDGDLEHVIVFVEGPLGSGRVLLKDEALDNGKMRGKLELENGDVYGLNGKLRDDE